MSRSRKKVSILPRANAGTMKWWKRHANKCLRQAFRLRITGCEDWDAFVAPKIREVSNVYDSPQDGYCHMTDKPDDLECLRDRIKDIHYGFTHRLESPDYVIGDDGHYVNKDHCECITNKKSWYWIGFRK